MKTKENQAEVRKMKETQVKTSVGIKENQAKLRKMKESQVELKKTKGNEGNTKIWIFGLV